eukprot:COSAG05_NODE_1077_length_5955_cov_2.032787_1_plen_134_part_00
MPSIHYFLGGVILLHRVGAQNEPCEDNDWDFHMTDTWGDGWSGNTATVSDCEGNVLADPLTLGSGSSGVFDVCLAPSDGYGISVGGGSYASEVGWSLLDSEGNVILTGDGAGTQFTCSCGCDAGKCAAPARQS